MDFPTVLATHLGEADLVEFRKKNIRGGDNGYPAYFVLDRSGICVHYQEGGLNYKDNSSRLMTAIEKMLL